MDFSYSEEQEAVRQLAGQIFGERSTHERLKQVEATAADDGPFDRELWKELADAGLLSIHLGEDVGGAGLDFVAACLVIEAAGRTAAYVPVVETISSEPWYGLSFTGSVWNEPDAETRPSGWSVTLLTE